MQYPLKAGGNEYQRMDEMKTSKASFILPVNSLLALNIDDKQKQLYEKYKYKYSLK